MISVVILTKDEELDLPGCLASVAWSDDVHVFDSFSADRTVEVAQAHGARVTRRKFDGYATQRNAALTGLSLRHEWVLFLDADERIPASSAQEIQAFVSAPGDFAAARLRRRDHFLGRWLKHAQMSPYIIRLMRPGRARYRREVNEVLEVEGGIYELREPFDHFPFSKGVTHWIERHNRYSTLEAREVVRREDGERPSMKQALFAGDFNQRRGHQKALFYRLPFRPFVKFVYLMFVRGAVLDGRAGVTYALLQMIYEYFIVLKTGELRAAAKSAPGPVAVPVASVLPAGRVETSAEGT